MPRAAFSMKTKQELRRMSRSELERYIATLRVRARILNGPARKSTEKLLAVASKLMGADREA